MYHCLGLVGAPKMLFLVMIITITMREVSAPKGAQESQPTSLPEIPLVAGLPTGPFDTNMPLVGGQPVESADNFESDQGRGVATTGRRGQKRPCPCGKYRQSKKQKSKENEPAMPARKTMEQIKGNENITFPL